MIYAHVYGHMQDADIYFQAFMDAYDGRLVSAKKRPIPMFKLRNDDEHWFMTVRIYWKWNLGRDYIMDGAKYHSGINIGEVEHEKDMFGDSK